MEPNQAEAWMTDVYNVLCDMRDTLNDMRNTLDAIDAKVASS